MHATTLHPGAHELLNLWERAVAAPSWDRAEALLEEAPPELGARNAALLALRARLFGRLQPLRCNCGGCGAPTEFTIDCAALAAELHSSKHTSGMHSLAANGCTIEFRVPVAADVRYAAARALDEAAFVRALLERCVTRCEQDDGTSCEPHNLPAPVAQALSQELEALEPGAIVSFALQCPECGAQWDARMDCADVVWSEVQARAERLLLDVAALGRAFGWNEAEVLALSPTRRAAYLELAGGAW